MLFVSILKGIESLGGGVKRRPDSSTWPRRTLPSSPRFFLETLRGRVWDLECCPGLEGAQTDMVHIFLKPPVTGEWTLFLKALA